MRKERMLLVLAAGMALSSGRATGAQEALFITDYEYTVPSFVYTGSAARVELWPSQHTNKLWGVAAMDEVACEKGRRFEFANVIRDRVLRFRGFDADGVPVDVRPEEIVLEKQPKTYMKRLTDETWADKLRRVAWWQHDRFGLFIHFGLYALPARHEWLKSHERISEERYDRYFRNFNPERFDARAWARAAKAAGMKYVVLTTKHHEGFCLWDTAYTDYKVTKTPFGRDLLREFVDAFRAEGLRIGFYYSVIDWHHPDFTIDAIHPRRPDATWDVKKMTKEVVDRLNAGRDMARYREYVRNQVRELLTNYGKVDIVWYDFTLRRAGYGEGKTRADYDSAGLLRFTRSLQPDVIVDNRLDLDDYEDGQDFLTPEQCRTDKVPTFAGREWPWETCQTFSGSWGYYRDEKTWKSSFQLLEQLILAVSHGGNLIMNVGPTGAGEFDERAQDRLAAYGRWLGVNGASIYGCGAAPKDLAPIPNTLYTYNAAAKKLYVHFLAWTTGPIPVPFADRVAYAQLLHDRSEITLDYAGNLHIPLDKPNVEIPVVELTLQ